MPKNHFLLLKKLKNTESAQLCAGHQYACQTRIQLAAEQHGDAHRHTHTRREGVSKTRRFDPPVATPSCTEWEVGLGGGRRGVCRMGGGEILLHVVTHLHFG